MGRSAACFKFIACGGSDTKDADEEKSNGCGWSFHKRSSQHRVLNNSAVSESPVQNKEISECIDADDKARSNFDATEKFLPIHNVVEKPQLSAPSEVKVPEFFLDTKPDSIEEEAAIVIIQAAIRAYMAQKELLKLSKVIKIQAVVRGHLVRRHAVRTLRCVQTIVKMQALVTDFTPEVLCQPTTSKRDITIVTTDPGSDILASAVKDLKIDETPAMNESIELSEAENQNTLNEATDLDCCSTVKIDEIVEISNVEPDSLNVSIKSEGEIEQPRQSGKGVSTDQLETEPKRPSFGSRRISNPEFTAIQSKFEELSSAAVSSGSMSLSYQENGVNSKVLEVPSEEVDRIASEMEEISEKDNSVSDNLLALIGGSESGTELSISSMLDSPDRDKDVEKGDQMQDTDDQVCKTSGTEYREDEVNKDLPEESVDSINKLDDELIVAASFQQEHEREEPTHDVDSAVLAEVIPQQYIPSPEASPRSHMTFLESQGTPASQASVNTKGNRAEKSVMSHKRKSLSAGKKSPANPNPESASGNSKEFPKDRKITRRRSLKRENAEQEPRDSNSNSTGSIPHFMQATESALAKLNANNSPRSSPDVLDRELHNKKRHSLPGANGRQDSPRIQRSMSQDQRGGKANGTQTSDRKWVR